MRVLVCGSREWRDAAAIRERLRQLPPGAVVIHGAARGADGLAGMVARSLGLKVIEFPPDWEADKRRAGILRNLAMLDTEPDLVIAFWLENSPGTGHTVAEARRRGIPVEVVGLTARSDPREDGRRATLF